MGIKQVFAISCLTGASITSGYSFVPQRSTTIQFSCHNAALNHAKTTANPRRSSISTQLSMVDQNVIQGGAIAFAGLATGLAMVLFTEKQGERAKERGQELGANFVKTTMGQMMEDVEVDNISDMSTLTSQLEQALLESGGAKKEQVALTEEEMQKIKEDAEDGW